MRRKESRESWKFDRRRISQLKSRRCVGLNRAAVSSEMEMDLHVCIGTCELWRQNARIHVAVGSSLGKGSEEFSFHIAVKPSKALTKIERGLGSEGEAIKHVQPGEKRGWSNPCTSWVIYGPHFAIKTPLSREFGRHGSREKRHSTHGVKTVMEIISESLPLLREARNCRNTEAAKALVFVDLRNHWPDSFLRGP
jgi:hypothetical protein